MGGPGGMGGAGGMAGAGRVRDAGGGPGGPGGETCAGPYGAEDCLFPILAFDGIDRLVEADGFLGVLIEFDLIVAGDEAG
jgi:hypothetical protein